MEINTNYRYWDISTSRKKIGTSAFSGINWKSITKSVAPYIMIAPAMIISVLFMVFPIIYMVYLSFFKWNMIGDMKFIGLENYISMLKDKSFLEILGNTMQFTILTVCGFLFFGVIFALYLKKNSVVNRFLQTIMFLPYVVPMISIAFIWMWMMDSNLGLLNYILGFFGIDAVAWLENPQVALKSLILVNIWKAAGYYTLIILSALQSIPTYIFEAAQLDNAHPVTTFFKITLPMISPTLFFLILTGTIASFKVFETINVMTQGGPNNATNSLVYYTQTSHLNKCLCTLKIQ